MQRVVAMAVLLLSITAPAVAQTVYGRVTDASTGRAVAGVALTLVSESRGDSLGVTTGDDGRYSLTAAVPGRYLLRTARLGYSRAAPPPFELRAGERTVMDITLSPEGIELDPIEVTGNSGFELARFGFDRRCGLGRGVCLDVDSIDLREARTMFDVLRDVEGLSISWRGTAGYSVRSLNGECLRIFLNYSIYPVSTSGGAGLRTGVVRTPAAAALAIDITMLDPSHLMGAEIYLNPRDVPRELRESMLGFSLWSDARPCGAIILWTRAAW